MVARPLLGRHNRKEEKRDIESTIQVIFGTNLARVKGRRKEKRRGSGGEKGKRCLPSCTDTLSSHSIRSDSLEPEGRGIGKIMLAIDIATISHVLHSHINAIETQLT